MESSVFRSLISFQDAPCYCLFCYVQAMITTTTGLLKYISLGEKCFIVDCYVLSFYNQYHYGEISKLLLSILSLDAPVEVNQLLFSIDLQQFSYYYFLIKLSWNIAFIAYIISVILWYFEHNFFAAVKEIHKVVF